MRKAMVVCMLALLVGVVSCSGSGDEGPVEQVEAKRADAYFYPTGENTVNGSAIFIKGVDHVELMVSLKDAPKGKLAVRIHDGAVCDAQDASSAGGPWARGAIGNVVVGDDGEGQLTLKSEAWSLLAGGDSGVLDKPVVLFAEPIDFDSDPMAAGGDRVACGLIRAK